MSNYEEWKKNYKPTASLDYSRGMNKDAADMNYLAYIEKYKGTPYYEQMVNNPYLFGVNSDFSPNFGQAFMETVFTDTSARDRYYQELVSQRNSYLSNLVNLIEQTKYNSPENQLALEKAAGLNPDLTGISGTGMASENDQPAAPVNMPDESLAPQIAHVGITLVTSLFNFGKAIQEFEMNDLAMASQEIKNNDDALNLVIKSIANSAPFKDVNEIDDATVNELSDYVLKASSKADYSGYSRRTRRLMKSLYGRYDTMLKSGEDTLGVASLKAQLRNSFVQNQSSAARGASSLVFDESFNKMVKKVADAFSDLEFKLEKLNLEAGITSAQERKAEDTYNTKYFNYASSQNLHEHEVGSQIEGYEAQKKYNEAEKLINDTWEKVISYVKAGDEWYNALGVILCTYLRSQTLHFPSINISGPKSTTNYHNTDNRGERTTMILNNEN